MIDLDACPCSGRNLDKLLAPAILLHLRDGDLHGYKIVRRLADSPFMSGRKPDAAGVYRILRTMESRGLLSAAWELDETGPAKRTYHLSDDGRRCLARWHASLEDHAAALAKLLTMMREALPLREEPTEGGTDVRE